VAVGGDGLIETEKLYEREAMRWTIMNDNDNDNDNGNASLASRQITFNNERQANTGIDVNDCAILMLIYDVKASFRRHEGGVSERKAAERVRACVKQIQMHSNNKTTTVPFDT
jgi:hypothetical protein